MSDKKANFCSHCGTTVKPDDVFCNNCGASLEDTIEPIAISPVQNDPYTQTTYPSQATVYVEEPRTLDGLAIVSLIFGILSIIVNVFPFLAFVAIVAGIIDIITGAVSIQKTKRKYLVIAGITLGIIGIGFGILFWSGIIRFWGFWW